MTKIAFIDIEGEKSVPGWLIVLVGIEALSINDFSCFSAVFL